MVLDREQRLRRQTQADEDERDRERGDDVAAAYQLRYARSDLRADDRARADEHRPRDESVEVARGGVRRRADRRHDREDEVGGRGRDVGRESEEADERRDVDDPAADAEDARGEAHDERDRHAERDVRAVAVEAPARIADLAHLLPPSGAFRRGLVAHVAPPVNEHAEREEEYREDDVEEIPRDDAREERTADAARQRGDGEDEAGAIVDPTLSRVRDRSGSGVHRDDGERDRRHRTRREGRFEERDERNKKEAASR